MAVISMWYLVRIVQSSIYQMMQGDHTNHKTFDKLAPDLASHISPSVLAHIFFGLPFLLFLTFH